jgi:hypothetical protein
VLPPWKTRYGYLGLSAMFSAWCSCRSRARYLFVLMPQRPLPRWLSWFVRFSFGLVI